MWAGVRSAARLYLACPDAKQIAFVLEHPPQFPSYGRIVPPVAPASAHASPPPLCFQRREVFSTNEPTVIQQSEQDQQIRGQVREFSISPFILFPAGLDACFVCADPLLPTSVIDRQGNLLLSIQLPGVLYE